MNFEQTFNCYADPRPEHRSGISYVRREFRHHEKPLDDSVRVETARRLNGIQAAAEAANRYSRVKHPLDLNHAFALSDSLTNTSRFLSSSDHDDRAVRSIRSCMESSRNISKPVYDNFESIDYLSYSAGKAPIFSGSAGFLEDSALARSSMSRDSTMGLSSGSPAVSHGRPLPRGVGDGVAHATLFGAYASAVSAANNTVSLCTTKDGSDILSRPGYAKGRVLDDLIYV
ncbi:Hypothetical protein GLP15_3761 [Giardia lamblia P15]|uniref:Uncharacterized protein n=1 Tax=Giardia intestinalis (strain P15) TaxID=658858 RepID=E1F288_GIAIA|nr:Hypothetical protein GLP15_3761 [Giardia lamblia P15]